MSEKIAYNKTHPFLAALVERSALSRPGSEKNTYHIVLDLRDSGISYQVGDSVAVQPFNDPDVVEKTLAALKADGSEKVVSKHTGEPYTLRDYLYKKANLSEVPRKLISELSQRQVDPQKKVRLESLFLEGQKEMLKEYQAAHEVWDALMENAEVTFSPQEFCLLLQPLLPRFYSIASAQAVVGDKVHLTVAELVYVTNDYVRRGTCTHYLCNIAPMHEFTIPVYIQPSQGFTLPEKKGVPVIMVGPGTGVAPFRAFMQERLARGDAGNNWLFFGERHRQLNFFYEEYWQELIEQGQLRLETAFSRDQENKIYVQHRMLENGPELFSWLDQGGYFYVCGDAHRMAKDVDATLLQIVQIHGKCSEVAAKDYVKKMKAEKRYLRDVY